MQRLLHLWTAPLTNHNKWTQPPFPWRDIRHRRPALHLGLKTCSCFQLNAIVVCCPSAIFRNSSERVEHFGWPITYNKRVHNYMGKLRHRHVSGFTEKYPDPCTLLYRFQKTSTLLVAINLLSRLWRHWEEWYGHWWQMMTKPVANNLVLQ